MYAVNIYYNDAGPFTAMSSERSGLFLSLFSYADGDSDYVCLWVMVRASDSAARDYRLTTIKPGDRISVSYQRADARTRPSIETIESHTRQKEAHRIGSGRRLALDTRDVDGNEVRLSHPPSGAFSLKMMNAPLDHMRVSVSAQNDSELWTWQLVDLHVGESAHFKVVETDWNTPFPDIKRRNPT
jgi:hypothetical protein